MSQSYGIPAQGEPDPQPRRPPARYLVLIDAGGTATPQLFQADRTRVGEFLGGGEEVAQMSRGLTPTQDAGAPEWDTALAGHSAAERAAAQVYTLDV